MASGTARFDTLAAYLPLDRRYALVRHTPLPEQTYGTAILTDLSGFTALTEAFVTALGAQRGAEDLTFALTPVYDALITLIHAYGGSVVGFSGDGLTCWFDDGLPSASSAPARATTCALALQDAMRAFAQFPLPGGGTTPLALKASVATGPARRFVVGDPAVQLLDTLAGATLDRVGELGAAVASGETLLDEPTHSALAPFTVEGFWSTCGENALTRAFSLTALHPLAAQAPWPPLPSEALDPEPLRAWILPAVWERLHTGLGEFLTELRPIVALFVRFGGINFAHPLATQFLDGYLRWVQSVLVRYAGALIQLTIGEKGSYFYAVFGAPIAHADMLTRAVAAALELRTPPPHCSYIRYVQIGLSSGQARAGAYGARTARTYGVLGGAVNLGARLMQAAGHGVILASQAVRAGAGPQFEWASLPPLQLKGLRGLVPVYGLVEARANHGVEAFANARAGSGLLAGRDGELAALADALAAVQRGQGQCVGITGEPGMGTSRILLEGVLQARAARLPVYAGAAQSYGAHTPYLAWRSVWRAFFELDAHGALPEQVCQIEIRLNQLDQAFSARLPLLGPVLGLAIADTPQTAELDAEQRKVARETLLVECLRTRARGQGLSRGAPLVLALEDCQWLDPLSRDLLLAIARACAALPVLILLSYRAGETMPLPGPPPLPFTELRLGPLSSTDAERLVEMRLQAGSVAPLPEAVVAEIIAHAEGNPFYIEELLHEVLARDPSAPHAWPDSLHMLLLARLDRLGEGPRLTAKVASVAGRRFETAQLWGVYPQLGAQESVTQALEALVAAHMLAPDERARTPGYVFPQALTQELTYASLPHALRTQLHEQCAAWLEARYPDAPPLDLLAYHYGRSANLSKQRHYFRLAADAAAEAYAHATAAEYYTRLLALLPPAEQGEILLALGHALELSGAWDAAVARYTQAGDLALELCDDVARAWALLALGVVRRSQGAYAEAGALFESAQVLFDACHAQAGVARALAERGRLYEEQNDYARAQTVLEESVALSRTLNDEATLARALNNLGRVASRQGQYAAARAIHEQSLRLQQGLGDKAGMATVLGNLGVAAAGAAETGNADDDSERALYETSLKLRREVGDKQGIAVALNNLARLELRLGRHAEARAALTQSLALARELGNKPGIAFALTHLGLVAAAAGEEAEARALLVEGLLGCHALDNKRLAAHGLTGLAALAITTRPEHAAHLLGAVDRMLADVHAVLDPFTRRLYARVVAAVREAQFADEHAQGYTWTWEQIIAQATP